MKTAKAGFCRLVVILQVLIPPPCAASMQSLADVARQEAERRRQLERQGVEARVITGNAETMNPGPGLTVSSPADTATEYTPSDPDPYRNRSPVRSYRNTLQKLDRDIRLKEERLQSLKARLQAEKWKIQKTGRLSGRRQTADDQSRLQLKIDELEATLKGLRQERAEVYDAGRKAGFLPGELEGKGVIP